MIPITSENLAAVGYDSERRILYVQFHKGQGMHFDVPQEIYHGLLNAFSKGEYHAKYIKGVYRYQRC